LRRKRIVGPATIQRVEHHAYDRAADLAKSYAEHWEAEAARVENETAKYRVTTDEQRLAELKAGHWRIIEKEIRALAHKPAGTNERPIFVA
jgi:hypothetical protein